MTWQRILYGTLVASGLSIAGTAVWMSSRTQIKAIDYIELFQAAQERCLATQYLVGSNEISAVTNKINVFEAEEPLPVYWFPVTTGSMSVTSNKYMTRSSVSNEIVTTTNWVASGASYSPCRVAPMTIKRTYSISSSNKYIWGPNETITIAGVIGRGALADTFNGTYYWHQRLEGPYTRGGLAGLIAMCVVDEYWKDNTNSPNVKLYDFGPWGGQEYHDETTANKIIHSSSYLTYNDGVAAVCTGPIDPPKYGPWFIGSTLQVTNITSMTVSAGDLKTNIFRSASVVSLSRVENAIDRVTSWYGISLISEKIRNCLGVETGDYYVDDTEAPSGEFLDCSNSIPALVSTSLWNRLVIAYTNGTGADKVGVFQDETNSGSGGAAHQYVANAIVLKSNLTDRARALQALRWTKSGGSGDGLTWTCDGVTNYFHWYAISTNSWSEAKDACVTGVLEKAIEEGDRPWRGTTGTKTANPYVPGTFSYRADAYVLASRLSLVANTQIEHSVDYYFKAKTFSVGAFSNMVFNDAGLDLSTNVLKRQSETSFTYEGVMTNNVFWNIAFPDDIWCNPPETNRSESAGFEIISEDAVLKWHFNYITNAIP